MRPTILIAAAAAGLCFTAAAHAAVVQIESPALDKWYYSNTPGPTYGGSRDTAPVFSNSGTRLGHVLLGFQTSGNIATGLGASNYLVSSVRVYLRVSTEESFRYDPTYDSYTTHLPLGGGSDPDVGRPVELFGLGLRNGYSALRATVSGATAGQFHENSPYFSSGSTLPNAFPFGFDQSGQARDVVDSVNEAFDYAPFAIGATTDALPGQLVEQDALFEFSLDLNNPAILAYIQQALNTGMLGFMVSSLHESSGQTGGTTYPAFYTRENFIDFPGDPFDDRFGPRIEIEYTVIPEPSPTVLVVVGLALFATGRAWRHRAILS